MKDDTVLLIETNTRQKKPKGNQEWTIQRHLRYWTHKTEDEDKQNTKTQHTKLKDKQHGLNQCVRER